MGRVITAPEQITPGWLTRVLRRKGFLERGEVINVRIKLTKTLMMSVVSRLGVDYSINAESAPSQLFLKISGADRSEAFYSEAYRQEVEFYNKIANQMPDQHSIACYDAMYSGDSAKSHLLLEDLSESHFQPESPLSPSYTYRVLAVESLARLHAYWWEHPELGKEVGALFDESWLKSFNEELENNVVRFVQFLGERISPAQTRIYDRLLAAKHNIWGRLTCAAGLTVTHGDAHWWNVLYPNDTHKDRVRLFDWQLWHIDVGPRDLAFMIALGGYAEPIAETDQNLIRHYYDCLIAHGVRRYTWDDFWDDYRWSAIRNLNVPVVQWSQGRSPALWESNLKRAMLAYEDLKCSELIGSYV